MVSIIFLYFKVKTLFKHCFVMLKLFIDFIFNDYLIFWPMIYHNILTIFLLLDVLVVINVFLNKTFLYLKLVSLGVGNQKNVGESYEHKTKKKDLLFIARLLFRKVAQICTPSFQQCMRLPTSLQPCQHRIVSLKNKRNKLTNFIGK